MNNDNEFNFNTIQFMEFLKDNNILTMAIAAMLSEKIADLVNTLIDSLIMPLINMDIDKDGVNDAKKIESIVISINGIKFKIGTIIIALIKFTLVLYMIFTISKLMKKLCL